ncbi:hypothetical protein THI4931_31140 [Pandoraea sputorum]|nr:hypothetical protein THI4931_31140 [Pandoraea sputorum]
MLAVADAKANGNIVVRASNGQLFVVDPADAQILSGDANSKATLLDKQLGSPLGAILSAIIVALGGSTETALEGAQLGQAVEGVGAGVTSFGTPRTASPVAVKTGNATNNAVGADSAANAVNGLNLNKSLASQQQLSDLMSGKGVATSGNGTNVVLRDAPRLVSEYGGQLSDWSKVSSSSYTATDGTQFEIHAYRNAVTGQVVEPKSIPLK